MTAFSRRELLRISGVGACAALVCGVLPAQAGWFSEGVVTQDVTGAGLPVFSGATLNYRKILMLGDSNSVGLGQNRGFHGGVMGQVARSLLNASGWGPDRRRGYFYETTMSPYLMLTSRYGWADDLDEGFTKGGACGDLAILDEDEWVACSARAITTVKFAFHPVLSKGGRWQVSIGKQVIASGVADGSGSTGDIDVSAYGPRFASKRAIKFKCVEGRILFQHAERVTQGQPDVPFVWCAAEGSQGFTDFITEERLGAIAPHVNARSGKTLVFVALGTNNFVSAAWKQRQPDEYVSELDACLRQWEKSLEGEKQFVLVIPPRPRVELPYAPYETYVEKTLEYARANPWLSLVRTDTSVLGSDSTADLYVADGMHLNRHGHEVWAQLICQHLGIALDDFRPRLPG